MKLLPCLSFSSISWVLIRELRVLRSPLNIHLCRGNSSFNEYCAIAFPIFSQTTNRQFFFSFFLVLYNYVGVTTICWHTSLCIKCSSFIIAFFSFFRLSAFHFSAISNLFQTSSITPSMTSFCLLIIVLCNKMKFPTFLSCTQTAWNTTKIWNK